MITPGLFLVHVVYTPDSDDATAHEDQAATYGGSEANRRRNYRIDPGVAFQAPFNGQLSVIAGGDSDRDRCITDVILVRGFRPRDKQREIVEQQAEMMRQIEDLDEIAVFGMPMSEPDPVNTRSLGPTGFYPPPIVGTPQLVHATWINVPALATIQFPDGAEFIEVVNASGAAGSPTRLTIGAFGLGGLALDCASGILRTIGPFGQGGACTDGTPATLSPTVNLSSITIWSRLGG